MSLSTREKVYGVIAEVGGIEREKIADDTVLSDHLDSLEILDVVIEVEAACDVDIDDAQMEACQTVGDIVRMIEGASA